MSEAALANLIKRLETATQRLEEVTTRKSGAEGGASSSTSASASAPSTPSAAGGPATAALDELIAGPLSAYVSASAGVGGLVQEQAQVVQEAIAAQKVLIQIAAASKKPDMTLLQDLLKPTQQAIMKITELREKNRASQLYNHLSTVSEGIPGLGWVVVEPAPGPFVGEMRDSAQFWANRVIKDQKDKDKSHVDWANSFVTFLTELQTYVKKYHTTGLAWNPRGGDAKSAPGAKPSAPAGGAPPPPPAPAVGIEPTSSKPAGPDTGALFSQLNKEGLTSGLRKVDKSEMTHKNPELRAASVVKAGAVPSGGERAPAAKAAAPKAPPKLQLDGSKWAIENQMNNNEICIEPTEFRQVAYIYNCQNSTIQIKGKINTVTMDNCKKVGLVIDSAVSTIDIVNCKSVQVQITGRAPTVVIDKTDGVQLYLSKDCADIEILTAKCSEMNVLTQGDDGEFVEQPIAEQFKTSFKNGALITVAVEHSG
ncbi:adenylate cyclase associated N terminal-domain-containing protein [Powellomyces hirtus]|nr:adenylate cyclase associated N terminal-domain-containing protein [Powellomyces hirtus]